MNLSIKRVKKAITLLQQGKMIVVQDAASRENEGDLVMAAQHAQAADINFMTLYGRGLVVLPMEAGAFDRLSIPMMVENNKCYHQTAFGVSIGAAQGITTGISAHDRALTVRTAADPASCCDDIVMPGHVFPLKAHPGGVLVRAGHTEGSIDLLKTAGLEPTAVLCEIMNDDGTMARSDDLKQFADKHDLLLISIQDIIEYRLQHDSWVEELSSSRLPVKQHGVFDIKVFVNQLDGVEHLVLISGKITDKDPLVRVHSECLTGDVFGSSRCDCGRQLNMALDQIAQDGGILIYLRAHEGRGIGLANKIKAYALQDQGFDTVDANLRLGFLPDERSFSVAAQILKKLSVTSLRLMTNNPAKMATLQQAGLVVKERIPIESQPTRQNVNYLRAKRDKLGHLLDTIEEEPCAGS